MQSFYRLILIVTLIVLLFVACGRSVDKGAGSSSTTSSSQSKSSKKSKDREEVNSTSMPSVSMGGQSEAKQNSKEKKSKNNEVAFEIPADIERNFPNQLASNSAVDDKNKGSNSRAEKEAANRSNDKLKNNQKLSDEQKVINNPKKGVEPHFEVCDDKEMPILRMTDTRFIDEKNPTISVDGKLLVYEGWFRPESGESAPLALFSMTLDQSLKKNVLVKGNFLCVRPFLNPISKEVFFTTNSFENRFHAASMPLDGSGSINLNYRKYCNDVIDISVSSQQITAISYMQEGKASPSIGLLNSDGTFYPEIAEGSEVSWSANGERFIYVKNNGNYLDIFSAKADGSDVVQLTTHFGICHHPSYSPDGEWVVFSAITEINKKYDLFMMSKDGKHIKQITNANENDRNPVWGKDGWIYFETERFEGNSEIAKIDGTDLLKKLQDKKKVPEFLK